MIPILCLRVVAALASAAGLVSRGSRRSAAILHCMVWSGTHDAIAPACGARRLRDAFCANTTLCGDSLFALGSSVAGVISAKICLALTKSPPLTSRLAQSAAILGATLISVRLMRPFATGESGAQGFGLR